MIAVTGRRHEKTKVLKPGFEGLKSSATLKAKRKKAKKNKQRSQGPKNGGGSTAEGGGGTWSAYTQPTIKKKTHQPTKKNSGHSTEKKTWNQGKVVCPRAVRQCVVCAWSAKTSTRGGGE